MMTEGHTMTTMSSAGPHGTASVAAILAESAARFADHVAVVVGAESTTYRELWDQARAYAGALRAHGILPGDRVAVLIPNVTDFPRVYYAVLALGAVVVPVHSLLKADEVEYVLRDSGSRLLVCAAPLLGEGAKGALQAGVDVLTVMQPDGAVAAPARLEDEAARATPIERHVPRQPLDVATILYTSGTTGQPKGAEGSHFALLEQTSTLLLSTFDIRAGDVLLGSLPLFHTFGQTCILNTGFRAGAKIVLMPKFDGETALRLLIEQRVDIFLGVPTMFIALLEAARQNPDRPVIRYAISGGAAIPVAIIERFKDVFGADVHEGYGLTETSPVATFNHVGRSPQPGSIGTPVWGVDVEIARSELDATIELLPRGELGEIVIRGHNLMNGYLNRPEATRQAIVDGWFRTGDLGTKAEDCYIRILDRKKDMVLRNGYNVYPREVEEVLNRHADVVAVAVFGLSHETHGQEVAAAVVLAAGSTITAVELIEYSSQRIAAYKYPRRIEIVDALPTGPSGKVLKRELVARYSAAAAEE